MSDVNREALTLGSLFDGIGGFPLVASRYGVVPLWASEIEPFPVKVTKKHFPVLSLLCVGLLISFRTGGVTINDVLSGEGIPQDVKY